MVRKKPQKATGSSQSPAMEVGEASQKAYQGADTLIDAGVIDSHTREEMASFLMRHLESKQPVLPPGKKKSGKRRKTD